MIPSSTFFNRNWHFPSCPHAFTFSFPYSSHVFIFPSPSGEFSVFFLVLFFFSSGQLLVYPWAVLPLDPEISIPYFIVHGFAVVLSLKEVTGQHFTSKMMQKAWKCLRSLFYPLLDVAHGAREKLCCICLGMPSVINCRDWAMIALFHHVVRDGQQHWEGLSGKP